MVNKFVAIEQLAVSANNMAGKHGPISNDKLALSRVQSTVFYEELRFCAIFRCYAKVIWNNYRIN